MYYTYALDRLIFENDVVVKRERVHNWDNPGREPTWVEVQNAIYQNMKGIKDAKFEVVQEPNM